MKKIKFLLLFAGLAAFVIYLVVDNHRRVQTVKSLVSQMQPAEAEIMPPTEEEKNIRFTYLTSHRLRVPINPSRYPVFIFKDPIVTSSNLIGPWRASGTVLVKDGKPMWLQSAAHCFSDDGTYYCISVVPGMNPEIWGIERVDPPQGSNDVVLAKIGTPTRIKGIPFYLPHKRVGFKARLGAYEKPLFATNQITGEQFAVIGTIQLPGEPPLYLMDYSLVRAESGSGFVKSDGETLIVSQFLVLSAEEQKFFRLTPRKGCFTALTGARVDWP